MALDERPRRSRAGRVIDGHARLWIEQVRHQDGHLARCRTRRRFVPGPRRLVQEVLIGAPRISGSHPQPQAVPGKHINQSAQVIRNDALTGGGALKSTMLITPSRGFRARYGAPRRSGTAPVRSPRADGSRASKRFREGKSAPDAPGRSDALVPAGAAPESRLPNPALRRSISSSNTSERRFEENQRQDVILELGRIYRPANGTGGLPEPILKRGNIQHGRSPRSIW